MSDVTISIINPDGSEGGASLTVEEQALLDGATRLLAADPNFQSHYPGAVLDHVESNRGVDDHAHGRLYLRFEVPGQAATEFWAHWGRASHVAFRNGNVTVASTQ